MKISSKISGTISQVVYEILKEELLSLNGENVWFQNTFSFVVISSSVLKVNAASLMIIQKAFLCNTRSAYMTILYTHIMIEHFAWF